MSTSKDRDRKFLVYGMVRLVRQTQVDRQAIRSSCTHLACVCVNNTRWKLSWKREIDSLHAWIRETSIKGVAERSSVYASEIFTAILPEEAPEVIHINEMHKCLGKKWLYWIKVRYFSLFKYENNNKEK